MDVTQWDSEEIKPWVVLQKIQHGDAPIKYLQQGPFSTGELRTKIYRGELQFRDYVWRKGFDNWTLISDIKDLQADFPAIKAFPRREPIELLIKEIQQESVDRPQSVDEARERMKASTTYKIEPIPPETAGEDLTEARPGFQPHWRTPNLEIIDTVKDTGDLNEDEAFRPVVFSDVHEATTVTSKAFRDLDSNSELRKRLNYMLGLSVVGALAVAGFYMVWSGISHSTSSAPAAPPLAAAQPPSSPGASGSAQKVVWPTGQATQSGESASLEVIGLGLDGDRPHLLLQTRAKPGEDIEVWVVAGPGAILNKIREERYAKMTVGQDPLITVEMQAWKLLPGEYQVIVRYQNKNVFKRIFVGKRNQQFSVAMAKYRAALKLQAQSEKNELQATILNLTREFQDLQAQAVAIPDDSPVWKEFFERWQKRWQALIQASPLSNLATASRDQLIFVDSWKQLDGLATELESQSKQLGSATKNLDAVTKDSLSQLQRLEAGVASLTPWDSALF